MHLCNITLELSHCLKSFTVMPRGRITGEGRRVHCPSDWLVQCWRIFQGHTSHQERTSGVTENLFPSHLYSGSWLWAASVPRHSQETLFSLCSKPTLARRLPLYLLSTSHYSWALLALNLVFQIRASATHFFHAFNTFFFL